MKRILLVTLLALFLLSALPVVAFRWLPVPVSAFILEQRIENLTDDKQHPPVEYDWVPMDRISRWAGLAVVAAEDQKFPYHHGFDVEAIEDAREHNLTHRRKRGASTISQQTAKNLFLWPGRTWLRKGIEAYYTVLLETLWPKQRILEVYLNIAQFGPDTYGVEAAARRYWHRPASQLTPQQCALLAAVLPDPDRFRVEAPSLYVQTRADWIRQQMNQLGLSYLAAP
ncbi:MAG TPA: monofunctional biosynthetic peptidoglycan transglycosylase [Stenotrophobium sp.]|nr:monofunctional biosynthetic peptidoglycan transglycosylase [Stenotrophobium sp.]